MYMFHAHYTNIETEENVVKPIELDAQYFESEKAIFIYAMELAYDMSKGLLSFDSIELIYC